MFSYCGQALTKKPSLPEKIPTAQKSNRSCCCWEDFRRRGARIRPKKQIWGARESRRFAQSPGTEVPRGQAQTPEGSQAPELFPQLPELPTRAAPPSAGGKSEQLGRKTEILVSSERFVGFSRWGRGRLGVQVLNSNPLRALWEFL